MILNYVERNNPRVDLNGSCKLNKRVMRLVSLRFSDDESALRFAGPHFINKLQLPWWTQYKDTVCYHHDKP